MLITALVTCYNRRVLTLACLERLSHQSLPEGATLDVVLVDDGSSDGTAQAVRQAFPGVEIIPGSGNLFWCGGMRVAWKHAAVSDPDYYLLFNDDTALEGNALRHLLELAGPPTERVIAVASIADEGTGEINYGGVSLKRGMLAPDDETECDTFTANCALVPRAVFQELGMLHDAYTHAMGDTDYGIQARKRGILIRKSGEFLGTCGTNAVEGTWRDRSLPRLKRLELLQRPKGLPFPEWLVFTRRNFGWKWPYYALSPMIRILAGR
ncbi:glycosyltransferase family 2 protein [Luteolibacter sp. SL250]|uniref:glycosyltransferase family 2 protein n=1 Tax=Luteolibacter sp. SL250 TaxID=2995170 RepID=UPI00226F83AD|nr:glycosyltransferase family 2 protein [Luteolibacter sp. SL250]WAC20443.1 glycosyltransferase family 2 protein [Luteolibacter sp. SL250]